MKHCSSCGFITGHKKHQCNKNKTHIGNSIDNSFISVNCTTPTRQIKINEGNIQIDINFYYNVTDTVANVKVAKNKVTLMHKFFK